MGLVLYFEQGLRCRSRKCASFEFVVLLECRPAQRVSSEMSEFLDSKFGGNPLLGFSDDAVPPHLIQQPQRVVVLCHFPFLIVSNEPQPSIISRETRHIPFSRKPLFVPEPEITPASP